MLLAVIALFSVLALDLIDAAAYQQSFHTSEPATPAQQRWLEQKLEAIAAAATGTVVGGLGGYLIRFGRQ